MTKPILSPAPADHTARKRKYALQGLLGAGAIGLGAWGVFLNVSTPDWLASTAQAQTSGETPEAQAEPGLDRAVASHVMRSCHAVALTAEDLAAMELSEGQAEAVLTRLAEWTEQNQARLDAADQAVTNARRALVHYERDLRMSQAAPDLSGLDIDLPVEPIRQTRPDPNRLRELRTNVSEAVSAVEALRFATGEYAMQVVPHKADQWRRAAQFSESLPVELRHLSTISTDRLKRVMEEAGRRGVSIEQALSFSERQQVESNRNHIDQHLDAMRRVEERVMSGEVSR